MYPSGPRHKHCTRGQLSDICWGVCASSNVDYEYSFFLCVWYSTVFQLAYSVQFDARTTTHRTDNRRAEHEVEQEEKQGEAGVDKHIRMLDRARCMMANAGSVAAAACTEASVAADHASAGTTR